MADAIVVPATAPKSIGSGNVSKNPATQPPILFPNAVARNHTPIMSPTIRGGASLVTTDSPTGLRHSSPTVWSKYTPISHMGLTNTPPCAAEAAGTSSRKPRPTKNNPNVNLAGLLGSRDPSETQIQAKTGARRMRNAELSDWNQVDGNGHPSTVSRVIRSAKRL